MMNSEELVAKEASQVINPETVAATAAETTPTQTTEGTPSAETNEGAAAVQDSEQDTVDVTLSILKTKEEVLARAQEIAASEEGSDRQELDTLKQLFYKYRKAELLAERQAFIEAGGEAEQFMPAIDATEETFKEAMQTIRQRRAEQQAEQERIKQENLKRKLAIIDRIKDMASSPEDANKAYDEFKALQAEWKEIKAVPAENATELWKNYQLYVEQFYDLLKMNSEMREYDFKKNLEAKTRLCELAEKLAEENDVISAFNQLQGLHQEYKEIGPVAKELREEIWTRFKAASTVINKRHQDHFLAIKEKEEENLQKKSALCERVETLDLTGLKSFADWNAKTEEVIAIQAEWKTIGYAPQKMNNTIFERFRSACDKFFQQKTEYFKSVKDELNDNLQKKTALCEQAEALQDSTEWRKTSDALIEMQKQWKTIGAVPHKFSDAIWKRFNTACDKFFEAKNAATADQRNEEKENQAHKEAIIEQLQAILQDTTQNDAVQNVKKLQAEWNEVGHVPFREKDKLFRRYREACDELYKQFGIAAQSRRLNNFKQNLKQNIEGGSTLNREHDRMMRAYEALRSEIQTYENNIGFLTAKSKKGNSLVDEMMRKVEKQKAELSLLAQKIKTVEQEMKAAQ
ncbi:MAG: DUF349 domain-containing protein [Bacteroidales bacterium]|nr:DUF349 domain-containing protein [Candidatus Physcousia equi]